MRQYRKIIWGIIAGVLVVVLIVGGIALYQNQEGKKADSQEQQPVIDVQEEIDNTSLTAWLKDMHVDMNHASTILEMKKDGIAQLTEEFNLSDSTKKELQKKPEQFVLISVMVTAQNHLEEEIVLADIIATGNQPKGFYLSKNNNSKGKTIGSRQSEEFMLNVLVNTADYENNEESVKTAVNKLKAGIRYDYKSRADAGQTVSEILFD